MSDPDATPYRTLPDRICGSGEMAERIRLKDWSTTPLGSIDRWSDTLVALVNFLLSSPFRFALYWGEDYTLLYNDENCKFLDRKHPSALGQKGIGVWPEAWAIIGPAIESAYHEGRTTHRSPQT